MLTGDMDDDEAMQETNSAAHVRIGSTLPARFVCVRVCNLPYEKVF